MTHDERAATDRRLARIEGQIRGIRRMIAEGAYCCDALNQIAAASAALNQVAVQVASSHIRHCIVAHNASESHPDAVPMTREALVDELDEVLRRLMR
jgi:DNA-binding FrmR family transcriptional regulator